MATQTDSIVVARDFSEAPGARETADGPKSAQEFYNEWLEPKFLDAVKSDKILLVDLDGTWGYASSFISGTFGELSKRHGRALLLKHLKIKSDEDPILLEKVQAEIDQGSRLA